MRVRMVIVPRCGYGQLYPCVCDVFQPVVRGAERSCERMTNVSFTASGSDGDRPLCG
jgi:hypothetical protein